VTGTAEETMKASRSEVDNSTTALKTSTIKLGAKGSNVYVNNSGAGAALTLDTENVVENDATGSTYQLTSDDTVILSSHAIPGNEHNVNKVIDGLLRVGAEVVHSGVADVHATGHAQAEELKMLMSIAKPELFIPVHGEFRHLIAHARLANQMGIADSNILLAEDGDVVALTDEGIDFAGRVPAGYLYVDGIVGDVGHGVLRDRRVLAEEGVVVVILTIDGSTGNVITGPEIITRGWVYAPEAEDLIDEATDQVRRAVEHAFASGTHDTDSLQRHVRQAVGRFVSERTRRKPMIVPVVMEA